MPPTSQAIEAPLEVLPEIRRCALRRRRWISAAVVLLLVTTCGVVVFLQTRPTPPAFR
jgi:hypothetical protein